MNKIINPDRNIWNEILARPVLSLEEIEKRVAPIMEEVQKGKDKALLSLTSKFDGVTLHEIEVNEEELLESETLVDNELKTAIQLAAKNIEKFHSNQILQEASIETMPGVHCWRKSIGIEKVGLYIPGGTAPLFSTVLMLAIPAKIAGCKKIILCSPPNREGKIHPAILYAAKLIGIHHIYKLGGSQAIAAMTFGTETVPQVYKIFGPGNQYVMAAKQLALKYGVAIDMPAGPSEVAVIADKSANPAFVAADLLSQAEHGNDSQVILFTNDKDLLNNTEKEVQQQLEVLSRSNFASHALSHSKLILVDNLDTAIEMSNAYAPEHLIIHTPQPEILADKVVNAGSVFLGYYSPESVGDYASGTNHTLPTNGYAKAYSGVSLDSFTKKITFQKLTKDGLQSIGNIVETLAEAESLGAHKNAVTIRLKNM